MQIVEKKRLIKINMIVKELFETRTITIDRFRSDERNWSFATQSLGINHSVDLYHQTCHFWPNDRKVHEFDLFG